MSSYRWTINGCSFQATALTDAEYTVREGERERLRFEARTMMTHPMHLHGLTFQIQRPDGPGARKDSAVLRPGETIEADFEGGQPPANGVALSQDLPHRGRDVDGPVLRALTRDPGRGYGRDHGNPRAT